MPPKLATKDVSKLKSARADSPSQRGPKGGGAETPKKSGAEAPKKAKKKTVKKVSASAEAAALGEAGLGVVTEDVVAAPTEAGEDAPAAAPAPEAEPEVAAAPATEAEKKAEAAQPLDQVKTERELWAHTAYGLFDRMDTDKSGLIDREELMAKLKTDGELEALLGVKTWGYDAAVADVHVAGEAEVGNTGEKDDKKASATAKVKAKEVRRAKMLKLLFDEFDVTADSVGIKEPGRKWQEAGASKPAVGRELTNEELSESLVGRGGRKRRRMFSRADLSDMGLKPDDLRADDYIKAGDSYFVASVKDDNLNRDEFRELVRLGRMRLIFTSIDKDNSGHVDRAELASKLQQDNEIEELLGVKGEKGIKVYTSYIYVHKAFEFDKDRDKRLTRDEFEALLTKATEQAKTAAADQEKAAKAAAAAVDLS